MDTPGTFTIKGACFNGVSAHGQRHVDRGGVLVKIIAKAGVLPTAALFLMDRHAVAVGAVPRSAHHLVADKFQRNTSGSVKLVGVRISDRPCPRRCPDRYARCRSSRLRNTSPHRRVCHCKGILRRVIQVRRNRSVPGEEQRLGLAVLVIRPGHGDCLTIGNAVGGQLH